MESPDATVIVCVYNRAQQIRDCLESIACCQDADFEIVVVDDGSTDSTPAVIEEFIKCQHGGRTRLVRKDRNQGLSAARNSGISEARGACVLFTDSDCTVSPGWVRTMVEGLRQPGVSAVSGTVRDAARSYAERAFAGWTNVTRWRPPEGRLVGNNMGFHRPILTELVFDSAFRYYCDDTDLAQRLRCLGHRIAFVSEAEVHHHHPMTLQKYLRTGYLHGQGSARFWYKHGRTGLDPYPLLGLLLTLPLALLDARLLVLPGVCALTVVALLIANEVFVKGKGWLVTLYTLPVHLAYNAARCCGVVGTWLRVACGGEEAIRASRREWRRKLAERG